MPVAPERAGALDCIRTVVSMGAPLTAAVKAAAVKPAWASASTAGWAAWKPGNGPIGPFWTKTWNRGILFAVEISAEIWYHPFRAGCTAHETGPAPLLLPHSAAGAVKKEETSSAGPAVRQCGDLP